MPDRLPLTPDALESLLADASHETVASFVADLLRREGRTGQGESRAVEREGRVITASRDSGEERHLVWTDDRGLIERALGTGPEVPEHDPIDAVVTCDRGAGHAAAVAERLDARVIDVDELHDRLLYAIDRESCRELCEAHFDRAVEPRGAPSIDEGADGSDASVSGLRTGHLLVAVAVLGVAVAAAAGVPGAGDVAPVAGVGGPVGTATVPPAGNGDTSATPPGGPAPTPAGAVNRTTTPAGRDTPATEEGSTRTPTPDDSTAVRCEDCSPLLPVPEVRLDPGSRTTITSPVTNPHPGAAKSIALRVTSPASVVSVEPSWGRSIDRLGPNETRTVTWELSVSGSANGTYDLLVLSQHRHDGTTTYARDVGSVTVATPPPEIPGECPDPCSPLDAGDREVRAPANGSVTLDATLRNPYTVTLTDVEATVVPRTGWHVAPSNETFNALSPGSSRRLRWNVSVPASAAGEYGLTVRATFAGPAGEARRTVTVDYRVYVTGPPPGSD